VYTTAGTAVSLCDCLSFQYLFSSETYTKVNQVSFVQLTPTPKCWEMLRISFVTCYLIIWGITFPLFHFFRYFPTFPWAWDDKKLLVDGGLCKPDTSRRGVENMAPNLSRSALDSNNVGSNFPPSFSLALCLLLFLLTPSYSWNSATTTNIGILQSGRVINVLKKRKVSREANSHLCYKFWNFVVLNYKSWNLPNSFHYEYLISRFLSYSLAFFM
jgi:hypothetical protein